MTYAVQSCPGWEHPTGCLAMDALGQPRCIHCGWSWGSHRSYGRPHPPSPPPDYDDETVARAFAECDEDDDGVSEHWRKMIEPAGPTARGAAQGE